MFFESAADYHPGKRTSRAQAEKIREYGYTGKIPSNMREASALIEILEIMKSYNRQRRNRSRHCDINCGE